MSPQDREDAWLARRIERADPEGRTHKKLFKQASPRVLKIAACLHAFKTECDAVQDELAIALADAPVGTVRQYIAQRGETDLGYPIYRLFNCNEANMTLSEVEVLSAPYAKREELAALAGHAFNQVQIFGPPFVWKPKPRK